MVWARRSQGTLVQSTTTLQPGAPAGFQAGDSLVIFTGEYVEANNTLSTPAGWTKLSPDVNAHRYQLFGLQAVGGDTMPIMDWRSFNGVTNSFAVCFAYSGGSLRVLNSDDRGTNSTNSFATPSGGLSIPEDNGLIIMVSHRNKTSVTDATTFGSPNQSFVQQLRNWPAGTDVGLIYCDLIQSAKADIANFSVSMGTSESVAQPVQGGLIALAPGAPDNSSFIPWLRAS